MFGTFRIDPAAGLRRITTQADATTFIRAIDRSTRPHRRIAQRMADWAWMSAADEEAADMAFRNALEIKGLLARLAQRVMTRFRETEFAAHFGDPPELAEPLQFESEPNSTLASLNCSSASFRSVTS